MPTSCPPSYWDPCIQCFTQSSYIRSLRSRWSLLGPDGKDSEGRTWVHWIVHQKWPVQCANLMNLFLLVVEIHAFKVLPSHMTMGHHTDPHLNQMGESQRSDRGPLGSPSKVTCAMCQSHELIPPSYWDPCIHLPSPHTFALLGGTDLCLDQMGRSQRAGHGSIG